MTVQCSGGEAASAGAVSGVGAGSPSANRRAAGLPKAAGARRARATATGAPRPPTRPSRGPAGLYLQRRLPSPGREARARPPFPARQAELAGRTDWRTDGRLGTATEGGPCPRPKGPGSGPRRGREGCRGGRDRPTGPQGQSLQPTTRPPPSFPVPGDARALTLARVSSRLLVPPSRRPSGPSSSPSGLSRQPERRLPRTRGVRRGGGGARRGGGGAGGSALGGPGAADHGAPENHTIPKASSTCCGQSDSSQHRIILGSGKASKTARTSGAVVQVLDRRRRPQNAHLRGYATKHVVEGLEPRTLYKFRLKVTSPSGEYEYSPVVSVSTTREPISSEHFHRAVNVNDEDLLVRILQGGNVKVDVPNKFGFTALMVAAQKGYTRLVKILVSNGTDVNLTNGSGKDSLMLACYAGHLDVVKYLRRHGASWETRDLGGCTALHWAADGGHCNVIDWMIKDGCEVDAVDTGSGWTPLMRVSAVSGNQSVASVLIEAGADVNMRDKDGKTPLMVAVLNNHEELVQLLLSKGADASVKNEFGKGVLEMARVFDRQNVVSLLEERKRTQMAKK
ncbi:fibronectin type 3 and ankyrin repeat domains protein 1 [Mustela putorius furo]|uniref:Fibronectin type 3 and ankyrin repeat domains protein 1 n=2 Tax=Mustela putorius furo TaxID=9669 RepID=A0A8U0RIP8_MUSPF|nr:fibronectin type 3 and ankyrin repeat domains protein 1 [Mustela putorius furo]